MKIVNSLAVPEIGDKIAACGGYEACIWDFYVVLNVTKTQIVLQPVVSKTVDMKNGGMDWTSIPLWDCPRGTPFKKKFNATANSYSFKHGYLYGSVTNKDSFSAYNHH